MAQFPVITRARPLVERHGNGKMRAEYVPTDAQRALVESAVAFGLTQADIAEQLGIDEKSGQRFSRGALYLMLQNRIYRGEIVRTSVNSQSRLTGRKCESAHLSANVRARSRSRTTIRFQRSARLVSCPPGPSRPPAQYLSRLDGDPLAQNSERCHIDSCTARIPDSPSTITSRAFRCRLGDQGNPGMFPSRQRRHTDG
jgi:hypothetical protein